MGKGHKERQQVNYKKRRDNQDQIEGLNSFKPFWDKAGYCKACKKTVNKLHHGYCIDCIDDNLPF